MRKYCLVILLLLLSWYYPLAAFTQQPNLSPELGTGSSGQNIPMVLEQAKKITWQQSKNRVTASGDVVAKYAGNKLEADTLFYNRKTQVVRALGQTRITSPTRGIHTGNFIRLDLTTNEVKIKNVNSKMNAWYISGKTLKGDADTELVVPESQFTSCNLETPHYSIRGDQIYIYPEDEMVIYDATFNLATVPVAYSPYLSISLKDKADRWEIKPGYSSEEGYTLKLNYRYLIPSDPGPLTTKILTDYREESGEGAGIDLGYSKSAQDMDLMFFIAERNPLVLDPDGNEVRADTEQTLWKLDSTANYDFQNTNWKYQSDINWVDNNRFGKNFQSEFRFRGVPRRRYTGSLSYSGDRSIFRIDALREDRAVQEDTDVVFRRQNTVLPRVEYQLFAQPVPFLGSGIFYSNTFNAENVQAKPESESETDPELLWSAKFNQELTKSISLTRGLGQSYTFGYEQIMEELPESDSETNRSIGVGSFELNNTYQVNRNSNLNLQYTITKQLNDNDSVPFDFDGESFGYEENGLRRHEVGLDYQWRAGQFSGAILTGYELRGTTEELLEPDSRILSPQLTFSSPISPRIWWDQYIRYDLSEETLRQSNTSFIFDVDKNFSLSFGGNFNRKEGPDLMKLNSEFKWSSSDNRWGLQGDIIYDQAITQHEEISLMLRRQLHEWNFQIFYREVRDRDQEIFFTFNLNRFPSKALGFTGETKKGDLGFERDDKSTFTPDFEEESID